MVFDDNELIGFLFKVYVIVLLSGITALPFVPVKIKPVISIISVFLVAILTSFIAIKGFTAEGIQIIINGGSFFGEIPLRIDALSAWFILIINFTTVTGVLYGAGYLNSAHVQPSLISLHWILYIAFQSSMLLVSMVQNSIAFIVAWEIMSLSSLLLVLFDYTNPKVLKAGINYLILGEIIITLSLITGLFGIMNAAVHRDFKKMLAYCTIENIGIIGIGIGLGLIGIGKGQSMLIYLGFGGALLHVLNHSLFKSLLFFSAGSVYSQTHTRDMDKLGGLIKKMPKTALLFLTGSIAIGGIPPLNGFISEFMIYCGILNGINSSGISQITLMIMTFAGMSIIGGISILTFTKTFSAIFLGNPRQKLKHEPVEVSILMLLPQYFIITVMIFIAFFPGYFINMIGTIPNVNSFPNIVFKIVDLQWYLTVMKNISLASVLLVTIIGSVFLLRWMLTRRTVKEYSSTWGCACLAPNERMQYTGKSFSKSFGKLLNFLLIEKKGYAEIERNETFPESRKYRSFYLDIFETKIINPVILLIIRFINLFQFIQNGKIQAYVIYGIVFILAIFLGTVLNLWH